MTELDAHAPLILASASARRRQLLLAAGIAHDVIVSEVDETRLAGEDPPGFAARLAQAKATHVAGLRAALGDRRPVLGADTIVVVDTEVIGKPPDRAAARATLRTLSARAHEVLTACCVLWGQRSATALVRTTVTFKALSELEIEHYLDHAAWHDKAGGYAVQDHAAYMVRRIDGSYTNVVGLPLCETIELLQRLGVVDATLQPMAQATP